MPTFSFTQARDCVLEKVREARSTPPVERVELAEAPRRVLAEPVAADRDYPATARAVRDGFAVRAADVPGALHIAGEVRAGEIFAGEVGPMQAVEIMTGAPVPRGADAIVMVEHTTRTGDRVEIARTATVGEFMNPQGCEARAGEVLLKPGQRLDYSAVALLAAAGRARVQVYRKPRVAILATGDEIVEVEEIPESFQIRNSNAYSLAAQVLRAGGETEILGVAKDECEHTRGLLDRGLASDMLLVSGGVSAGKYDIVERVLGDFGAEVFFDRVLIQPGQPLVFGSARGKFFFGLPGNPASTMVTFEVFARAAVEILSGDQAPMLPMPLARLTTGFRHKTGLTRFLPASLSEDGSEVTPVRWQGSGDIPALTRANAYLVADPERAEWAAGELIRVLLK